MRTIVLFAALAMSLAGCTIQQRSPVREVAYDFSDYDYYDRPYAQSPQYREPQRGLPEPAAAEAEAQPSSGASSIGRTLPAPKAPSAAKPTVGRTMPAKGLVEGEEAPGANVEAGQAPLAAGNVCGIPAR